MSVKIYESWSICGFQGFNLDLRLIQAYADGRFLIPPVGTKTKDEVKHVLTPIDELSRSSSWVYLPVRAVQL